MPNIAAVLKSEIARVARKEIRVHVEGLAKSNADQKKQISALRKQVADLERQLRKVSSVRGATPVQARPQEKQEGAALRWRPDGFAQHRKRLGISAEQMARLVGCSSLSIYKWESGKVRPRQAQLEAISRVRKLSRREALRELETSAQSPSRSPK
jgi:DNA-binding transcriptional regulator YiaG